MPECHICRQHVNEIVHIQISFFSHHENGEYLPIHLITSPEDRPNTMIFEACSVECYEHAMRVLPVSGIFKGKVHP